jgi:Cft2 family RNA processing exonuclease
MSLPCGCGGDGSRGSVRPLVCGPSGAAASLVAFGGATVLLNAGYDESRGACDPAGGVGARAARRLRAVGRGAVDGVLVTHAGAFLGLPELLLAAAGAGARDGAGAAPGLRVYATVATARAGLSMLRQRAGAGGADDAGVGAVAAAVTGVAYGEAVPLRGRVRAVAVASGAEPGGAVWVLLNDYSKVRFVCVRACVRGVSDPARPPRSAGRAVRADVRIQRPAPPAPRA